LKSAKTIVVGGGFAGLTAATRLIQAGIEVVLLERNKELGGRASSFYDENFGEWLDNGPHVFIGAYHTALSMLRTWGAEDGVDFREGSKIPFIYDDRREVCLDVSGRGGKLGQLLAMFKFKGMSFKDRFRTVQVIKAIIDQADIDSYSEPTVAEFLTKFGISGDDCNDILNALTVAIMNAPAEVTGIKPLAKALKIVLLSGKSSLGILDRPFQQLYVEPAKRFLNLSGVDIRTSMSVKSLIFGSKGQLSGVETASESFVADNVILAIPPPDVLRLLPDWLRKDKFFARFSSLESSPIAAVHLTFDRPVLNRRFAFFPKAFTHWIFARGQEQVRGWKRLSTITSFAPTRDVMSVEDIEAWTISDLRERLPLMVNAEVQNSRVIRTSAATWILKPGAEMLRPSVSTVIEGLYLAGDWCATGLPLTIESAARSGDEVVATITRRDQLAETYT